MTPSLRCFRQTPRRVAAQAGVPTRALRSRNSLAQARAALLSGLDAEIDAEEAESRQAEAPISVCEALFFGATFLLFVLAAAVLWCVGNPHGAAAIIGEAKHSALMRTRLFKSIVAWRGRNVVEL